MGPSLVFALTFQNVSKEDSSVFPAYMRLLNTPDVIFFAVADPGGGSLVPRPTLRKHYSLTTYYYTTASDNAYESVSLGTRLGGGGGRYERGIMFP